MTNINNRELADYGKTIILNLEMNRKKTQTRVDHDTQFAGNSNARV